MYRWLLALSFVLVSAAPSQAQDQTAAAPGSAGTIDPGMTRAQVIERLGKPATVRTYQGSTYLMYTNKCGKSCAMQDVVILDHDVVVDAMFRSPDRHYSGTSSSPEALKANSRTQRNQPLAVPGGAPEGAPGTTTLPTIQKTTITTTTVNKTTATPPADSAHTAASRAPVDSAASSMSRPPQNSAPPPQQAAPTNAPPTYGTPATTPPPADSAASSMAHPPADNSSSATSHPPKPPQ